MPYCRYAMKLLANRRLLAVKFLGSQKSRMDFPAESAP